MRVRVTVHAIARARERCPELAYLRSEDLRRLISADVREAIDADRRAVTRPRWLLAAHHVTRDKAGRTQRFVWPACESRAYVVQEQRDELVVLTTLAAESRAA